MRSDSAPRTRGSRILDDAHAIDGEVDHAVGRAKEYLRLRSRHSLVGEQIANGSAALCHRVVVMRLSPGLDEMNRTMSDPVADVEVLHCARRHWPARGEARGGKYQHQVTTPIHDQFSLGHSMSPAPEKTGRRRGTASPTQAARGAQCAFLDINTSLAFEVAQSSRELQLRYTLSMLADSVPAVLAGSPTLKNRGVKPVRAKVD